MKRVSVKIKLRVINPGDPTEVTVMGYEFVPGLFLHRSLECGENYQTKRDYWTIHHKSGLMVCSFKNSHTRKSILEPAIHLLREFDWTWNTLPADTKKQAGAVKILQLALLKSC